MQKRASKDLKKSTNKILELNESMNIFQCSISIINNNDNTLSKEESFLKDDETQKILQILNMNKNFEKENNPNFLNNKRKRSIEVNDKQYKSAENNKSVKNKEEHAGSTKNIIFTVNKDKSKFLKKVKETEENILNGICPIFNPKNFNKKITTTSQPKLNFAPNEIINLIDDELDLIQDNKEIKKNIKTSVNEKISNKKKKSKNERKRY
jgi:hypothetical protein